MSFAGWGSGGPAPTNSLPLGSSVGYGGWATGFTGVASNGNPLQQQQQQDEASFNSLFPVAGFVTGEQVKPIFEASGLLAAKLAQIWASVDKDHDGKINKAEFCAAMAMIRHAQSTRSLPSSALTAGFPAAGNLSKSWSTTGFMSNLTPPSPSSSGPGGGVSKTWAIKPQDMRKYMAEFSSLDVSRTGFLSGPEARTILTKSGLDKMILAKLWALSDIDKDGRLSDDEYAIAMHLVAKVRGGASLPSNLPPELYPGPTKYHTVDRAAAKAGKPPLEKMGSIPDKMGGVKTSPNMSDTRNPSGGGHARNPSGGADAITFEDRRKENFEAGRMELERRRRAIKEQQDREAAEKERRRREEEERRLQQEHEAELARQAELERQHRKAMEIELERERQMQRLALKREEEQRELERKRKAEWTRKKCVELEGQKDWEKKSLYSLRVQHSHLEDQLRQLDQKKLSIQASTERQKTMFSKIILDLKTMRLSHDVRRAEITKLQSELNGYHSQLGSLQRQRRELRESLQGQSPEMSLYQQQRQQLKDRIIGLAASLAGLRSNISYNTKTMQELTETFKSNSLLLTDLKKTFQTDSGTVSELREKVLTQHTAYEEAQRVQRAETARREEEERQEREERNRVRREVEERAKKEARLEKIKRDQAMALNKARVQRIMATTVVSKPVSPTSAEPPVPLKRSPAHAPKPPVPVKPFHLSKSQSPEPPGPPGGWTMEDELVKKKVQELQKRKAELQKQRIKATPATPSKPETKAVVSKQTSVEKDVKPKGKLFKQDTVEKEAKAKAKGKKAKGQPSKAEQLLDLNSSWDSTAQTGPGISNFAKDTSQILLPLKTLQEEEGEEEGGAKLKPPIPKPRSMSVSPEPEDPTDTSIRCYSVAQLSELFDRGQSPVTTQGWSSEIQPHISPKTVPSPATQDSDYTNLDTITTGRTPLSSPAPSPLTKSPAPLPISPAPLPTSPAPLPTSPAPPPASPAPPPAPLPASYKVLYDYQAADDSEVTVVEGDMVTFVPRSDASAGWLMVRVARGDEGWVPESYLEAMSEGGVASGDGGVSKATGQVMSRDVMDPKSPTQSISPGAVQAKVLFAWQGSKDNHLSLVRGEVVRVLQQSEKWWSGEFQGKVGWFPKTFVKILETSPVATTQPETTPQATPTSVVDGGTTAVQYEAIYGYEGEAEGDLAFQAGDIIEVTSSDGEWWTGVLNDVKGIFPSNYVQLKQEAVSAGSTPQSSLTPSLTPSQAKPNIARVVAAYQSSKAGQLNLTPGQLVRILKQSDNGWWEGEVQSRGKKRELGWFPANRVELLPQRKSSSSSSEFPANRVELLPQRKSSSEFMSPSRSLSEGRGSLSEGRVARAKSPLLEVLEDPCGGKSCLVLALYTYSAQSADELSFHKGSVITVLGKEGDWWKGEVNEKTGLFPSNYVQPLTEQQPPATEPTRWADSVSPEVLVSVSDTERKRQEAMFELLTSERHYVDSLKLVKEVFFDPMAQDEVLTEEEMAKVMVNWDELIRCSSELLSAFLVRLRTSGEVVRGIGDVLTTQIPNLTPHIRWCGCQLNACLLLQQKSSDPKFKEFEQKCSSDPRTGGLPLSSFLLKPMQRVTKYPLLVKRIMDYTQPADNDYTDLKAALAEAETLCNHVNEGVKQKENTEQLEWLQSHVSFNLLEEHLVFNSQTNFMGPRKLLHWGKFFKIRGSKDLVGFLFNDFLLLVRPKLFFPKAATPADLEPWGKNEFQMYRKPYLLDGLQAKKAGSDASGSMLSLLQSSPEEKDILLRVDAEQARDQWIKKLTRASVEFITTKKKMEREKKEQYMRTLRDSVGTLDVTVVKGVHLLAKDPNGKSDPFCVIRLGDQQEQTTPVIQNSLNPKWNYTMNFAVHDINKDTLDITVFDKDLFSPNDFLGNGRISLKDLLRDKDSPWEKTVLLENVASGEVTLKIALTLNKSNLLL